MANNKKNEQFILASHGSLATGMKSAIKMICGEDERIEPYDLDNYESPLHIYKLLENLIIKNTDTNYCIITDILGGSVQNALLHLAVFDNVIIVTGMNLGLVLSMLLDSGDYTLMEKTERAIAASIPAIQIFSKKRILKELEEYEKEDGI